MVFEEEQINAGYMIKGDGLVGNNCFVLSLPDSVGGENNIGEAVIAIDFDSKTKRAARTSLIGIKLYNKKDSSFTAYDKYYQTNKRVDNRPDKNLRKFVSYLHEIASSFDYKSITSKDRKLYCNIYFNRVPVPITP